MQRGAIRQRELFTEPESVSPVRLPPEAQQEVSRLLVLWMQAVAKAISEEANDDQDRR